jgi:hypothetical protein
MTVFCGSGGCSGEREGRSAAGKGKGFSGSWFGFEDE